MESGFEKSGFDAEEDVGASVAVAAGFRGEEAGRDREGLGLKIDGIPPSRGGGQEFATGMEGLKEQVDSQLRSLRSGKATDIKAGPKIIGTIDLQQVNDLGIAEVFHLVVETAEAVAREAMITEESSSADLRQGGSIGQAALDQLLLEIS